MNDIVIELNEKNLKNITKKRTREKKSYRNDIKSGDRFGKLVVEYYDKKRFQWFCNCDCGGTTFVYSHKLIKEVRSCYRCRRVTFKKVEVGEKYNNLTTLSYDKDQSLWICKCDCGNITSVRSNQLAKEKIKSCGCLFKGPRFHKRRPNSYTLKITLFKAYQSNAKNRGKEFYLSENEFIKLITNNCHYCGSNPSTPTNKRFIKYDKNFKYNGIDRIDNTKGYVDGNCVTCCEICNMAKSEMNINEFRSWIKRIYDKQFKQ